jgi:hypothetical protein
VRKIVFVVAGMFLASFSMARTQSLIMHQGFAGSAAWAQNWADPADDDSVASQPDMVPSVGGSYTGSVQDKRFGAGGIEADVIQNGSKLTGTWDTDINGGAVGTIKGSVKPNGKVHMRLKITGQGGCGLNVQGLFQNGDEIIGKYQVTGCGKSDHGTFDITD